MTVLRLIPTVWDKTSNILKSSWVQCRKITNPVLSPIDRFTASYNCLSLKLQNLIFREFSAQASQIVFWAQFDRFTAYYNCMRYDFKNLISPWIQCTSITNRVPSSFDRFTAYYNMYEIKLQKSHILVSSVQKYHKSCFDRFSSTVDQKSHFTVQKYHSCSYNRFVWCKISKNISPWVKCTSITNRVLSSFCFTVFYNCMKKNFKILYLRKFTAQVSQIVFWAHLTVLRLITSVWGKTSKISYLREFSAQVSQIVFSANLTILRLPTTVWSKTSKISYLREFSAQVSQIVFWPF